MVYDGVCMVRLGNKGDLEFLSDGDVVSDVYGKELLCVGNKGDELRFLSRVDEVYRGVPIIVEIGVKYEHVKVEEGDVDIGVHFGHVYYCDSGPVSDDFMNNREKLENAGIW